MPTIDELHTLLSQAERTVQTRLNDLVEASDCQFQALTDCQMDPYDKKWTQAKEAQKRAQQKYARAVREVEKLKRAIRNAAARPQDHGPKSYFTPLAEPVPSRGQLFQVAVEKWREECLACIADYAMLKTFPLPPIARPCTKQSCRTEDRVLPVCKCQIQHAFKCAKDLNLKKERVMWYPDKFSACVENKEDFQAMAKEIFVVVDEMYRG